MDILGYMKQGRDPELSPRSITRGDKFFTLGVVISDEQPIPKGNIRILHTLSGDSSGACYDCYHPESAKQFFTNFNEELLQRVIEVKQLNGLL